MILFYSYSYTTCTVVPPANYDPFEQHHLSLPKDQIHCFLVRGRVRRRVRVRVPHFQQILNLLSIIPVILLVVYPPSLPASCNHSINKTHTIKMILPKIAPLTISYFGISFSSTSVKKDTCPCRALPPPPAWNVNRQCCQIDDLDFFCSV